MRPALLLSLVVLLSGCSKTPPTMVHGKPVRHWVDALQDPDVRVRRKAVEVLGRVGGVDPAIVPALAGAVKDPDARVRREAIAGLSMSGAAAKEAIPILKEAQRDKDAAVRAQAAKALERLGHD